MENTFERTHIMATIDDQNRARVAHILAERGELADKQARRYPG